MDLARLAPARAHSGRLSVAIYGQNRVATALPFVPATIILSSETTAIVFVG